MMRKLAVTGALAAILSVGLASLAEAEKLSSEKATRATEQWAKERCEGTENCVKYAGRYCYPLSNRKRRCIAQTIYREADGNIVQCQTPLVWVLPRGESKPELRRKGRTRCDS
jgi:hypothetical protein